MTRPLTRAILDQDVRYQADIREAKKLRAARQTARDSEYTKKADSLAAALGDRAARGFSEGRTRGGSLWVTAIPIDSLGLGLDRSVFRDAVALRYGLEPPDPLPVTCPSCSADFSIDHALKCKKGGWVGRRHKEVLRAWKQYFERAGHTFAVTEPLLPAIPRGVLVRPSTTRDPDARADLVVRDDGTGRNEFMDVAVLDTGADCYKGKSTEKILADYEKRKEGKYADRVSPHGCFTPLICSVYGTLAPQAAKRAYKTARLIDPDRDERDAVMDLHTVALQSAVIRATSLCIRARSWTSLPPVGVPTPLDDAAASLSAAGLRGY